MSFTELRGHRRILVCGSRNWTERSLIRAQLAPYAVGDGDPPTIVHGDARGADKLAADIAMRLGLWVEAHPANWAKYGKRAGPLRNLAMLDSGVDYVIAFQRLESKGTQHTIDEARSRGIPGRALIVGTDYSAYTVDRWDGEVRRGEPFASLFS